MSYIGIDWGTSNFRAYLLNKDGSIIESKDTNTGLKDLKKDEFEGYLLTQIFPWLKIKNTPVILCGMVGSKNGWYETPYIDIKDIMTQLPFATTKIPSNHLNAYIISGACQYTETQMDVMRGEETQIYGYLHENPLFSGYLVLPGTHNKWVKVKDGQTLEFHTFMTGELYQIIKQYSILSSMIDDQFNQEDFLNAVQQSSENPSFFSNYLFTIRASNLLDPQKMKSPYSFLSGLLIGLELAAYKKNIKPEDKVIFIGTSHLTNLYKKACNHLNISTQTFSVEHATILGMVSCMRQIKGD
ncbi:MAG: 2-dehydro-3-deoxygalactonokinase [Alphaproteobacteria bacterium]